MDIYKIKINDKFNNLTVIEEANKKEGYCAYYWKCLCSCGNERVVSGTYLINGKIKSCVSCSRKKKNTKIIPSVPKRDRTGERNGKLVCVSYRGKGSWLCRCDCGKEKVVTSVNSTRSCGDCKSLVGKVFERLFVMERRPDSKYLCRCNCGVEKEISSNSLKDGSAKSCGCLARERWSNIEVNQRFEKLTCIEKLEDKGGFIWKCRCDCGNTTNVKASNLLKENGTKSCGCYRGKKMPEGVLDNIFGILTAFKYLGYQKWLCRCNCGVQVTRKTRDLLDSKTTHCGCLAKRHTSSTHQQCVTCKEIKLLHKNYFGKDKKEKYGFRTECSNCRRNKRTNEQWLNVCLSSNIQRDRRKGQEHNIDLEFLQEFLKDGTKCVYCGYSGKLGLDRIDNTLGHLKDNVLPCCEECNRTRSNKLTVEQMKLIGPVLRVSKDLLDGQPLKECTKKAIILLEELDTSLGVNLVGIV